MYNEAINMTCELDVQTYLKTNLDVLEPGLTLLGVDVHVRDDQGSDGRIDILARDVRGYHVVIELKRHRSAAREGFQELAKYVRLLAEQSGLPISRMRCFIVSPDWNALHAAFAVLKPIFPCRLTGYTYTIGSDSIPRNFEPVSSRPPARALSLATQQFMIAVQNEEVAEEELQRATKVFGSVGIEDYVAFVFDRRSDYLLYYVIQTVPRELFELIARVTDTTVEPDGTPTRFGDWEYAVFCLLVRDSNGYESESGSPVALARLPLKYPLIEVRKYGRLGRTDGIWSNTDLFLEAVSPAYSDPDRDQPPPPDLLNFIQEFHQWDFDL
ncbi:MAG TPA: endonuclease NucS domain-containing protein [Thermoanaerobaculia bacterium]